MQVIEETTNEEEVSPSKISEDKSEEFDKPGLRRSQTIANKKGRTTSDAFIKPVFVDDELRKKMQEEWRHNQIR